LEKLQGGQVAVVDGKVKAELPLPIAGLVSDEPLPKAMKLIDDLNAAAHAMGCDLEAPFMTLSFLSLSPIPELKLTDQGLIDAVHLRKTTLFA
jgi:adenine deaminase